MKITIDLDYLKIIDINVNQILTLIKIHFNSNKQYFDYVEDKEDLKYLRQNKYVIFYEDKTIRYFLREKGRILLEKAVVIEDGNEIRVKEHVEISEKTEFTEFVSQYRDKFKGLRSGSMGSLGSVRKKLKRWMKENPDVTQKEILDCVDMYIDSLNGNFNYLQRADYFIYKQNNKREEDSRLSIFLEELNQEPTNSDWATELK